MTIRKNNIIAHFKALSAFLATFFFILGVTDRFYQHQSFKEGGVFIVNMVLFGFISLVFGILGAFSGGTDKPQRKGCLLGFFSSQVIFFLLTVFFALIFSENDVYKVNAGIGVIAGLIVYAIAYAIATDKTDYNSIVLATQNNVKATNNAKTNKIVLEKAIKVNRKCPVCNNGFIDGKVEYLGVRFKNQICFACAGNKEATDELTERIFVTIEKINDNFLETEEMSVAKSLYLADLQDEKTQAAKILNPATIKLLDKTIIETKRTIEFLNKKNQYNKEAITSIYKLLYNLSVIKKLNLKEIDTENITKGLQEVYDTNNNFDDLKNSLLGEIHALSFEAENAPEISDVFSIEVDKIIEELKNEIKRYK